MKTLEKGSKYEKADTNGDGIVSDKELEIKERMILLENRDKKGSTTLACMVFCNDDSDFNCCAYDSSHTHRSNRSFVYAIPAEIWILSRLVSV